RHTRCYRDWSSDVCSSDLAVGSESHDPFGPETPGDMAPNCDKCSDPWQLIATDFGWLTHTYQPLDTPLTHSSSLNILIYAIKRRSEERRVGKDFIYQ